jgi:hypothetical protein
MPAAQPIQTPANSASTAQTRFNSLTHGATSKEFFIPGENPADFEALLYDNHRHYKPATLQESDLVKDLTEAHWFLRRCQRAHAANEYDLYTAKPDVTHWIEADFNQLNRFDRYKASAERSLQRALKNALTIRREKVKAYQWQQLHELQKQKLELKRQKFELAQAREKRIAELHEIRKINAANKGVTEIRSAKNAVSSPAKTAFEPSANHPPPKGSCVSHSTSKNVCALPFRLT